MNTEETCQWLMENGGPVIRYRTAAELMPHASQVEIIRLREELVKCGLVKTYFERFLPSISLNDIHGGKVTAFENVIGKLTDFGLGRGIPEIDEYTLPYRKWLKENADRPLDHIFDMFMRTLVAGFLARAGYHDEPAVKLLLLNHLEEVYDFTKNKDYDVFVPGKKKGAKPELKRELISDLVMSLPTVYDIVGWGAYLPEHGTKEELLKADTVIEYVLTDEYQGLPPGYDIKVDNSSRSWAMGWNVQVPGFPSSQNYYKSVGHMVNLLINFRAVRLHPWLKEMMAGLEEYRTGDGTYLFPREYLPENSSGYWIIGACVGLEENRRNSKALEVESTFWMARFKKALTEAAK